MAKRVQRDFFELDKLLRPGRLSHGGELSIKSRKVIRPLDPRKPAHITMRSSKARGKLSLRTHHIAIERIIFSVAKRTGVIIHKWANVGNHLHLLIGFKSRAQFQRFLREVSGLIARKVTGARKGKPFGKFWDLLAHSRVVTGLRDLRHVLDYVFANQIEGAFGTGARKRLQKSQRAARAGPAGRPSVGGQRSKMRYR